MDASKNDNTITSYALLKAMIKKWKVFAVCLVIFPVLFYGYYGLLKREYEYKALFFFNLNKTINTKYGVYNSETMSLTNLAELLQDPINLGSTLKTKYSLKTSIVDNSSITLKSTSVDSNVHIKLKEVVENFNNRIDVYFKNEMKTFFFQKVNNNIEELIEEITFIEKQMASLKAIEEDVSLVDISKDKLKELKKIGLSIDLMRMFSREKEAYDEFMFYLKRKEIEKEAELVKLKSQLEELSSGIETLENVYVSKQLISVFYPRNKSEMVNFNLRKKILLGAILGFLVAFFIIFFDAMRRNVYLNND